VLECNTLENASCYNVGLFSLSLILLPSKFPSLFILGPTNAVGFQNECIVFLRDCFIIISSEFMLSMSYFLKSIHFYKSRLETILSNQFSYFPLKFKYCFIPINEEKTKIVTTLSL
jgi:hypothetical protein